VQHVYKAASKLAYLKLTSHTDLTGATWHKVQHGALALGQTGLLSATATRSSADTGVCAVTKQKSSSRSVMRFTHCEYAQLQEVHLDGCTALTDKGKHLHFD
jgi:hypothetical protein